MGSFSPMEPVMTSEQLARHLQVNRAQIYRLVSAGMPHLRLGPTPRTQFRFHRGEAEAWLRRCSTGNSVELPAAPPARLLDWLFMDRKYAR